nr:uncharacterized protein SPCC569.03 [Schizosaccharomyces pombe]Q9Y7S2.2 RecName: Full=UPF0612 protein C569.003 [Schizosaccharomyces pombe 972h-]CAB42064.2 cell surface glycoprotein (predicted), DUF1773 family protein 4 [Schizosaccharomyces pombe]|eukprot:NP_588570.2 uncharacterized protein SPCC569.03 [Schizosaccharomyces pombe]
MTSNENFENGFDLPPPDDSAEDLKLFIKKFERSLNSALLEFDENNQETIENFRQAKEHKMRFETECDQKLRNWKRLAIEREVSEEQSGEVQFPRWIDEWANTKLGGIFERIFSKMDSMQNDMNSRFDAMQTEMSVMKNGIASIKGEMAEMKGEMTVMKNDIASIKGEMAEMKGEMAVMKNDIASIKGEMAEMKGEMTVMKNDIASIKGEMAEMKGEMTIMKSDIDSVKGETTTLKGEVTAMKDSISQLDRKIDLLDQRTEERFNNMAQTMQKIDDRSCKSMMLTRKYENMVRSDMHYSAVPVPFLNGDEPRDYELPPLASFEDIDNLTKEQCIQYLHGYGVNKFSPLETVKLKERLQEAIGLWSKGHESHKYHTF